MQGLGTNLHIFGVKMDLPHKLFWDVNYDNIDWQANAPFEVQRVLTRGMWEDFKHILKFYGKDKVKEIVKDLKYLDKRAHKFCSVYFDVPMQKFKCYDSKQFKQTHWNY